MTTEARKIIDLLSLLCEVGSHVSHIEIRYGIVHAPFLVAADPVGQVHHKVSMQGQIRPGLFLQSRIDTGVSAALEDSSETEYR